MHESVVFFVTGMGQVTGIKICQLHNLQINIHCSYFPNESMFYCSAAITFVKLAFEHVTKKSIVHEATSPNLILEASTTRIE